MIGFVRYYLVPLECRVSSGWDRSTDEQTTVRNSIRMSASDGFSDIQLEYHPSEHTQTHSTTTTASLGQFLDSQTRK